MLGGPGSPGVLIAKQRLFRTEIPVTPAGGTVLFVSEAHTRYDERLDEREEGGTPDIVGTYSPCTNLDSVDLGVEAVTHPSSPHPVFTLEVVVYALVVMFDLGLISFRASCLVILICRISFICLVLFCPSASPLLCLLDFVPKYCTEKSCSVVLTVLFLAHVCMLIRIRSSCS